MANNPKQANVAVNAATNAVAALLNSGYVRIYDGAQPATADTAITTQTLLAELTFGATAFGSAVAGVATANAIGSGTAAATGTAAWFRTFKTDGTTAVYDGSVGTSGCDMNLGSTAIQSGGLVSLSSFTYTLPKS